MSLQKLFAKVTNPEGPHKYIDLDPNHSIQHHAEPGQHIHIVALEGGEEVRIDNALVIVQSGDDLKVVIEGGTEFVILGYADTEEVAIFLTNENGEAEEVSMQTKVELENGDLLYYAQGDVDQMMDLVDASYTAIQIVLAENNDMSSASSSDLDARGGIDDFGLGALGAFAAGIVAIASGNSSRNGKVLWPL